MITFCEVLNSDALTNCVPPQFGQVGSSSTASNETEYSHSVHLNVPVPATFPVVQAFMELLLVTGCSSLRVPTAEWDAMSKLEKPSYPQQQRAPKGKSTFVDVVGLSNRPFRRCRNVGSNAENRPDGNPGPRDPGAGTGAPATRTQRAAGRLRALRKLRSHAADRGAGVRARPGVRAHDAHHRPTRRRVTPGRHERP